MVRDGGAPDPGIWIEAPSTTGCAGDPPPGAGEELVGDSVWAF